MQSMLSSSLLNTAAGLLSLFAGLASSIVVARLLGVEGSGIVAYALWLMTIGVQVSGLGLTQALLRFIGRGDDEGGGAALVNAVSRPFALSTGLLSLIGLAYAVLLWQRGRIDDSVIWIGNIVLFAAYGFSTMSLAAAEGLGRFRESTAFAAVGCLIQPFAVLAGGLILGPAGAIFGHVARHLPQALALYRYRAPRSVPSAPITPEMRVYARDNWVSSALSAILTSRVELAIIGFYLTLLDVGYYAVGATMSGMVLQVGLYLAATLVPYLGYHHDRGDHVTLVRVFNRSLLGLTVLIAPIAFGGAAIAPVLIPTLFGASFTPAVHVAVVLLIASLPLAINIAPARLLLATRRSGVTLRVTIVSGLFTVAAIFSIVPVFGGEGAAWIKGGMSFVTLIFYLWYCRRRLDIAVDVASLLKVCVAAGLCAAAAFGTMRLVDGLPGMILGILIGGVIYPMALIALGALPRDLRDSLGQWAGGRLPPGIAGALRWVLLVGPGKPAREEG
ncbi:lipopolysaccharide biosynthesis protein [Rhizobium halophytocola]|uniref:O-antigen/teichoic acid export membrane protein n=1 Tax=Rhizobium halophytocola TaxID=735519 RepID=A0ABS4DSH9_9HYPH|nr:polysaccharide biosynthesis C-terminal domain-containing protein [Rhizobium halophytocola]MBP1848648.1 O-antigen/teichoic acid export membrane protein [Rhizobium halophytocola]